MSSDRGFIALHRKIFENPIVGSNPVYFRAWVWLLSEAAWAPSRRRVVSGRTASVVSLERGQLTHSRRFIAEALSWSEKKVRTFLKMLKNDGMIDLQTGPGQYLITICKYDDYQINSEQEGPQTGQQTGPQRAGKGPKLNKDNKDNKEDRGEASPPSPKVRKAKRAVGPIPDGFSLDEGMRQYAATRNFVGGIAERMFQAFCNSAMANGREYADWRAAWRTWVDNQAKWNAERAERPIARVPKI